MESLNIWSYFILSLGFGGLSLLTPCVFPLIPITVSYFLKRQEDESRNPLLESLVYSLGIVFTFTILGLFISILFGAAKVNQLAANPYLNLFIGFLFIFFALNLMGFFEIRIPSWLLLGVSKEGKYNGIISTIFMALTFTITTFTCTMPFLGTILISASKGDWFYPIVGMLGYSLAFALPFFLLSLFPDALKKLPKSGNWMVRFKVVMGFLEIAASLKFFSNVDLVWNLEMLSRDVFLILLIIIFLLLVAYLLGTFKFPHEYESKIKTGKIQKSFSFLFLILAIYLGLGIKGIPMGELEAYLPPKGYGKVAFFNDPKELHWIKDIEKGRKIAKETGKNIFIDFTGFTCVNCRWMEQNIFVKDDVKIALENYVLVQLYTDGDGDEYEKNQEYQENTFGTIALPLYVIIDPNNTTLARFEGMTRKPEEFRDFILKPFKN